MLKKLFLTLSLSIALMTGYATPSSVADSEIIKTEQTATELCIDDNCQHDNCNTKVAETGVEKTTVEKRAEKSQNVKENDPNGTTVTGMAMVIVVSSLVVLAILFFLFGKVFARILAKKKRDAQGLDKSAVGEKSGDYVDSGEVIAAISMALAEHFDSAHDMEDTVLTIKRMKRAYSPWNSKIYNMREMPKVTKK